MCCRLQPDPPQAATLCAPGELALFERKPRGASVVAMDKCLLLVLEEQNFASFMDCLPSLVRRIEAMRNYAQHQARSSTFAGAPAAEAAGGGLYGRCEMAHLASASVGFHISIHCSGVCEMCVTPNEREGVP